MNYKTKPNSMLYTERLKSKSKSRTFASGPWWSSKNRFNLPPQTARKQQNILNNCFQTLDNRQHGRTVIPQRREINEVSHTIAPFSAWRQFLDHWCSGKTQAEPGNLAEWRRWSLQFKDTVGKTATHTFPVGV